MPFHPKATLANALRKNTARVAILAALACGGDTSGPPVPVEGAWNLVTIKGRALPTVTAPLVELQSNRLVLRSDGTFTDTFTLRATWSNIPETFHEPGTWTRDDDRITLTYSSNGSSGAGTLDGDLLTMDFDGPWVFIREQSDSR
jgi:hypothetical protein